MYFARAQIILYLLSYQLIDVHTYKQLSAKKKHYSTAHMLMIDHVYMHLIIIYVHMTFTICCFDLLFLHCNVPTYLPT